jgi:hypothetical protein
MPHPVSCVHIAGLTSSQFREIRCLELGHHWAALSIHTHGTIPKSIHGTITEKWGMLGHSIGGCRRADKRSKFSSWTQIHKLKCLKISMQKQATSHRLAHNNRVWTCAFNHAMSLPQLPLLAVVIYLKGRKLTNLAMN